MLDTDRLLMQSFIKWVLPALLINSYIDSEHKEVQGFLGWDFNGRVYPIDVTRLGLYLRNNKALVLYWLKSFEILLTCLSRAWTEQHDKKYCRFWTYSKQFYSLERAYTEYEIMGIVKSCGRQIIYVINGLFGVRICHFFTL